jgi:hypothetical protein
MHKINLKFKRKANCTVQVGRKKNHAFGFGFDMKKMDDEQWRKPQSYLQKLKFKNKFFLLLDLKKNSGNQFV